MLFRSPELHKIDTIINVYKKNIMKLKFSGPSNFSEIIRYIGDFAEWHITNKCFHNYFVLLIITDGQISDINDTMDEIVRCSDLPVSIIIVGVGNRNFANMDKLDADINPIYSRKYQRYSTRDIVQFVPFSRYVNNADSLSIETLEELPGQVVDYMTNMKIDTKAPSSKLIEKQFYDMRKLQFTTKLGIEGESEAAKSLLMSGFPVESTEIFLDMLNSGYTNQLAVV